MKQIIVLTLFLGVVTLSSFAQLPAEANAISPLLVGEKLPFTDLKTPDGKSINTQALFAEKPSVVLIYRGGWCPYCNVHLSEVQEMEDEIIELGYQIIAVSPDSPQNLKVTTEKEELRYNLYADAYGKFIKSAGIAFKASPNYNDLLDKKSEGLNDGFLPVPSVFVVDRSGKIEFEHISPDYKTRLSGKLLLSVVSTLSEIREQ